MSSHPARAPRSIASRAPTVSSEDTIEDETLPRFVRDTDPDLVQVARGDDETERDAVASEHPCRSRSDVVEVTRAPSRSSRAPRAPWAAPHALAFEPVVRTPPPPPSAPTRREPQLERAPSPPSARLVSSSHALPRIHDGLDDDDDALWPDLPSLGIVYHPLRSAPHPLAWRAPSSPPPMPIPTHPGDRPPVAHPEPSADMAALVIVSTVATIATLALVGFAAYLTGL